MQRSFRKGLLLKSGRKIQSALGIETVVNSGVFRISVRRGRGAVGVERGGCAWWTGLGRSPEKIICPQNDVSVHFDAVFNRQKTRAVTRSFGTWILRGLIAKGTLHSANYPKIHGQIKVGGGRTNAPPEYATGCKVIRIGGSSA